MGSINPLELGMEQLKAGNIDAAIRYLEKATADFPDDYRAFNALGVAYARKSMHNKAIGALEVARKLRPRSASIVFNLGLAYQNDGFDDRAEENYREALRIDPCYVRATDALRVLRGEPKDLYLSSGCYKHTDEQAVATCAICRLPICQECRTGLNGQVVCLRCAEKYQTPSQT